MQQLTWLSEPESQNGDVINDGREAICQLITKALDCAIQQLKPDIVHLRKVRDDAGDGLNVSAHHHQGTAVCTGPPAPHRRLAQIENSQLAARVRQSIAKHIQR